MRTIHPIAAIVTAASIVFSGFVLAPAASADAPPDGDHATDEHSSVMTIPYDPTFIRVETDTTGFTVFAYPQCDLAKQCFARIELPTFGIDKQKVSTKDGYKIAWPSTWAEGATYDKGTIRSVACDGLLICNSSRRVSLPAITRPYKTDRLQINYTGKDDAARTMTVAGQATKNASIRLKGGREVTTADGKGLWSATIGGLALGSNTRTIQQYVGDEFVDEQNATVTIVDPVKQGQIVGQTGTAELAAGTTSDVSVTYTAKSAFKTPSGKLTLTAPEGTTFAPGQDQQRGQYHDGSGWHDFGGNSIVGGDRSPDGTKYEFQLGNRNWDVAKDQQFRFTMRVVTPADVATTSSVMTGKLVGSFTGATFDTTARTSTTVTGHAFDAAVRFDDDVTKPAEIHGHGRPGATVRITGAWYDVPPADVDEGGEWRVTLRAPDAGGVRHVVAVQTADGDEPERAPVDVDYGPAVRITSPGDCDPEVNPAACFQITPIWNTVQVSGQSVAHAQISLGEDGDPDAHGTIEADDDGKWKIRTSSLDMRVHEFVVTAVSRGANTTTASVHVAPAS